MLDATQVTAGGSPRFPPGPPPARNVIELLTHFRELQRDLLNLVGHRFATYGDFLFATVAGRKVYHACHPDLIHEVLVTQARAFRKRTTDLEVLGHGLLTSDGDFWRRQRRRIQPAFRHDRIQGYAALMVEETERFVARLKPGQAIELRSEMMNLTLSIVCRALFGQQFSGNGRKIAKAMRVLQEAVVRPKLLPSWLPTPRSVRHRRMISVIDDEIFGIIDRPSDASESLLHQLRTASDEAGSMSRTELRDEVVTLFLAGHETTALALSWAFYLVALHPAIDEQLFAEILTATGGEPVEARHQPELPLTERVLKETMRLYPPVYVIPRIAAEPVTIADYRIPADSELWLWIYFMHRDPRWYELPDRFNPDRFLPDGEHAQHPRAYAPFGQGTRICIGREFAMLEAVIVLASVLQNFRLRLLDSRPLWPRPRVTLAPGRPLRVQLEKRSG